MNEIEAKNAVEGKYIVVDNEPCVVRKRDISSPGKHGSAKVRIQAEGLFDKKIRVFVKPGDARLLVPDIEKRVGQVLSVSGNIAQILDLKSYETLEIEIPEGINVAEGQEIVYWNVNGRMLFRELNP